MEYKAESWLNGAWYVGDGKPTPWWVPCRILDQTPKQFAKMLIIDYNADVRYTSDLFLFSFRHQEDANRYRDFINMRSKGLRLIY